MKEHKQSFRHRFEALWQIEPLERLARLRSAPTPDEGEGLLPRAFDYVQRRLKISTPEQLIHDLTIPAERILLVDGPSQVKFTYDHLPHFLVLLLVTLVGLASSTAAVVYGCFATAVLIVVYVIIKAFRLHYTRYVLTSARILRISGVWVRQHEWIPWGRVTDVSLKQSTPDRLLGIARVRIESANEASAFKEMADLGHPREFMKVVVWMVAHARPFRVPVPDTAQEFEDALDLRTLYRTPEVDESGAIDATGSRTAGPAPGSATGQGRAAGGFQQPGPNAAAPTRGDGFGPVGGGRPAEPNPVGFDDENIWNAYNWFDDDV